MVVRYEEYQRIEEVIELRGYYFENGESHRLTRMINPTKGDVNQALALCRAEGVIKIFNNGTVEAEKKLTIYCGASRYLPMFGVEPEDLCKDEYLVMTLHDASLPARFVSMLGEPYPEQATTDDPALVLDIAEQFIRGEVPRQLKAV